MQTAEVLSISYGAQTPEWNANLTNSNVYRQQRRRNRNVDDDNDEDSLPKDPRQWSREHVAKWLKYVIRQHGLPDVPTSRFLMNGKALCLMSPNMFLTRVPLGGKLLYKDFQLRLCSAMYSLN